MTLRLKDFRCPTCKFMWEEVVVLEEPATFFHCGIPAEPMIGAPMIKYVEPHFNRPLGKFIRDAGHLEREQRKQGVFTPTKKDIEDAADTEPIKLLQPTQDKEAVKAKAEKTWSHLFNEHKVQEFKPS